MALSCRYFRIIVVLVISGKQPSSGLLQLCGLYLCVLAKSSATVVLFNNSSTSRKHFVFQAILSHRAINSTNVDGTASQTPVPGYHTLSMTQTAPRGGGKRTHFLQGVRRRCLLVKVRQADDDRFALVAPASLESDCVRLFGLGEDGVTPIQAPQKCTDGDTNSTSWGSLSTLTP